MFGALKRVWLPLVMVLVVAVGGFTVYRVRGYFGAHGKAGGSSVRFEDTKPFHPKVVIYDIFSPDGTVADINYLDLNAQPQRADGARLPWSLTLSTTDPAVSPDIVAQGYSNSIGCRITIDGVVKDERVSNGVNAQAFCLVQAA
jgi:hypothetical protein